MSLFRKPKKTIIQRRVFTENNDDDDAEESTEVEELSHHEKRSKKKDKEKKKQPLLSFETEEEGEVFQVKKSSHNKKVMRMFEKEKRKKGKDRFEKEETKPKDAKTEVVTEDIVLVVNQNYAKPPTPPAPILSGRDALCAGKDDLSSDEEKEDDSPRHRFSKPDNVKKVLESGAIPDAAMIHAARKRRQKAREMGDFIPVEEEEPEDTGRLVRDDDNEESDEERIDMDVNLDRRDQERRREQFLLAQESDHELDEWEDQQIRKGFTGAAMSAAQDILMDYTATQEAQLKAIKVQVPVIDPDIPRTPETIAEKLREHFRQVCSSRQQNLSNLRKIQEDLEQATEELDDLKIKAPKAAEKFRFYQELRGYVTDLVECLDEKVSSISNLEQRSLDLMGAMSKFLIERRRQDIRDQAEEATSKGQLKKGPEDEEKVRRAAEREGRRSRRRRAREFATTPSTARHVEGMSSDEEMSQQDTLFFEKEKQEIEQELQEIFEDVVEDYSSIVNILIRFEHWRSKDPLAYNEAFASFCLPKVVSPLIRLKLVFWNPLNSSNTQTVEIEKLDWYRTLALYGLHDDETESSLAKDPDNNLLPTIVEKVLVPKLTKLVDCYWDPLSSSQTIRLVGCVGRFIRKYPTLGPDSKSLHNLFAAILCKIKLALDNDVFIPVTPKIADSKNQFFQRQFAGGLKLLKNIASWQGIINESKLKELALNLLLNRYLLIALKFCTLADAGHKIRLISQVLPRVWLQENASEFQMFNNAIDNLQQQLDKNNPLHLETIDILNGIVKTLRSSRR